MNINKHFRIELDDETNSMVQELFRYYKQKRPLLTLSQFIEELVQSSIKILYVEKLGFTTKDTLD